MKKICSLLVLCATVVFASCSKDDPVTEPVPEGITVTTYDALLDALQTGGTSADAPTLVTLGGNITIPAGGDYTTPPMNGSGHFKIDGGGHTMTWEDGNNYHFLGNFSPDADAVYIELTNINLVQQDIKSAVCVINGRITLGKDVALTMNGQYGDMIVAVGEKAVLELGEGFELSCTAVSSSCCVIVQEGATLVLNGGKTAAGAYIDLNCDFYSAASHPLISVPKALTGDVHLLFTMTGVTSIAQGAGGYQLTQADCDRLKVNPESMVSLYGEPLQKYGDNFELYLDPAEHQIELRLKNFTPPTSGNIDMTSMTADEAQLTIRAALAAGFTELKLTGELSKIGMGGNWGTFINNKKITKCDLTGVTGWGRTPTLPELAFVNCTALQEVTLPDDVRVIGSSAFFGCAALTTVNLSQVTWINLNAFYECTSLEMLILDNVTEIGRETFYGCTSLKTLKIPKCTRFGNYIVTGCKALTRIEATATGDFADLSGDDVGIERTAVFHNSDSHSGDSAFNPAKCDLVLNADKKQDGNASPQVFSDNEWLVMPNGQVMQWNSITFVQ